MRPNTTCGMSLLALTLFMGLACADDGSTASSSSSTSTGACDTVIASSAAGTETSTEVGTSTTCDCGSASDGGTTTSSSITSTGPVGESSTTGSWCHDSTSTSEGFTTAIPTTIDGTTSDGTTWDPIPTSGSVDLDCCQQYGSLEDSHVCAANFGDYCYFCTWEPTVCPSMVCVKDGVEVECCLDDYGMTVAC